MSSIISNSFKKNAGKKVAKQLGVEDEETVSKIIEAWTRGFEIAESLFTEQVEN